MINKLVLQSVINKYYLGVNEKVVWKFKDNTLQIDFMSPTRNIIGKVIHNDISLKDCELAIFDTKKLQNLLSICNGELLLDFESTNDVYTKLKISDMNFNLDYALSDPIVIPKVGTVNVPEWKVEAELDDEDIVNIVKAKSALSDVDNMLVTTSKNMDDEDILEFIFGDESGHNNKITYQLKADVKEKNIKLPFNSELLKNILHANKDMEGGKLYLNPMGLMKLEFENENVSSEYYLTRMAEREF